MNWKRRFLFPWLKALMHTLGTFIVLSLLAAVWCAFIVWILGEVEPKWGNEWDNFRFDMMVYSAMTGIQTGVVFICSSIIALATGRIAVRGSLLSIATLCILDVCLTYYAFHDEWRGLIIVLGVCPVIASAWLLMPRPAKQSRVGTGSGPAQ